MIDDQDGRPSVACEKCGHETPLIAALRTYSRLVLVCRGCQAVLINRPNVVPQRQSVEDASDVVT